jgi:hypothetical protein
MTKNEMRTEIHNRADTIAHSMVEQWRFVAENEVWLSLPPAMSFDDLPNVVRAIAEAALHDRFTEDDLHDVLRYSALHGLHRSQEGFQEAFLYTEYHLMRRSLWDMIRSSLDPSDAVDCITRVDAVITLATMAGLRGFHQQTFIQRGEWPAALHRLLQEWPLTGQ